jgi:hypothetical protein
MRTTMGAEYECASQVVLEDADLAFLSGSLEIAT